MSGMSDVRLDRDAITDGPRGLRARLLDALGLRDGAEFELSSDPRDFGATHRLLYSDGTEELLCIQGDARLERLKP